MAHQHSSPFATLEQAFRLLSAEPSPLCLDGTAVGHGLPARPIPVTELRSRLLHPSTRYATRDAVLDVLVERAQTDGGAWTVVLVGVLLPGLRRAAAPLLRACPGKADDIEAETVAGLLAVLPKAVPGRERVAARLTWAARRSAERLVREELADQRRAPLSAVSAEPPAPFGHPDLVLARAVEAGVLCPDDAELVGATRLGELSLAEAAELAGLSYRAAVARRNRAERLLVAWLHEDFVADPRRTPGLSGMGRPRQGRRLDRRPGLRHGPRDAGGE